MAGYVYRGTPERQRMAALAEEVTAWTARQRIVQAEYRRTRALVDWFAADPYGTREIANRHANTLDTAPPSA